MLSTQGLKYPGLPSFSDEPGKMYILDLLHPKPTPVELQIRGDLDLRSFNPHGISVYIDDAGDVQIRLNSELRTKNSSALIKFYKFNRVNIVSYCNN